MATWRAGRRGSPRPTPGNRLRRSASWPASRSQVSGPSGPDRPPLRGLVGAGAPPPDLPAGVDEQAVAIVGECNDRGRARLVALPWRAGRLLVRPLPRRISPAPDAV